jgi:protein O-mannosyl-transferase
MQRAGSQKRPTWIRSHIVPVFLVFSAIWTLLLYSKAIFNPFSSYDDLTVIVRNAKLSHWSGIVYFLRNNISFVGDLRGSGESYYRPLYWLSLALDRKLWGTNPLPYHLTSLALHWLNGCLLFMLLRRVGMRLEIVACTVLIWLALPINSEAVAWIAARAYLLAAFFVLLSALLAQIFLEGKRAIAVGGYAFTALCALLCHEAGILVLPLTVLVAYRMEKLISRSALVLYGAATGASAVYFTIKHCIGAGTSDLYRPPAAIAPFGIVFLKYLGLLVLPVHMSVERSTNTPPDNLSIQAILAWVFVLGIFSTVILIRRRWPIIAMALAWISFALAPFCGLVPIYQGMAERFLYFASMGLALLVADLCFSIPPQARSVGLTMVAVWLLWGSWRLHRRLVDWSDSLLLYRSSLEGSPRSTKLLYNLGAVAEQRGGLAQADLAYRSVLRMDPNFEQAIAGLANVQLRWNAPKEAAELYRKALSINPQDAGAVTNYAASLQESGDLSQSEAEYRLAISLSPTKDDAYCGLGVVLLQEGNVLGAMVQFIKAQRMNPLDPTPYYDLGSVYEKVGRFDAAAKSYRAALDLKPNDPDAKAALLRIAGR